jgi:hypothetical protein
MTGESGLYELAGPGLAVRYRQDDGKLDLTGDDHLLTQEDLDAEATVDPVIGVRVTATLIDSTRNGTRVTLTLLLPEVGWDGTAESHEVTGVAIVTRSFRDLVGGPPQVLQRHEEPRPLRGTVSRPG